MSLVTKFSSSNLSEQDLPISTNIEPKFAFGLTTGVTGNCLYLNNYVIVYPAAGVIVVHNLKAHSQRYVYLNKPRSVITAMDVNLINRMLAVATIAEEDDDGNKDADVEMSEAEEYAKPIISIYDLKSLSFKHVFIEPDEEWQGRGRRRFTKIRFLFDNSNIAALVVGGSGWDCVLYIYGWRNSTVETYVRVNGFVADVVLNPIDLSICCFVGKELFQLMTKTETGWSQYGFREANGIHFTCVCWLCSDRCLAGTADGRMVLFKNGELQCVYIVDEIYDMDVRIKSNIEHLIIITQTETEKRSKSVRSCIAFEIGLVIIVGDSNIYHFQKIDNGERYVKNNAYVKNIDWHIHSLEIEGDLPLHYVESACISPNGKTLTCITRNAQLHSSPLHQRNQRQTNLNQEEDEDLFNSIIEIRPLYEELHYGGIGSLSMSLWRPILITGGKIDFTVKLWDYVKCTLLLSKHYNVQVLSVSIHPTALYSVVAFSDHVEFQIIRIDDLEQLKYFPISDCNVTVFSGSGHMFALAKLSGDIEIYNTHKLEKCFSYTCHSAIGMLVWSNLDKSIIIYDTSGVIYAFHPVDGDKLMQIMPHSDVIFTDLVVDDFNRMYITAKDGILREIYDHKVVRELNLHKGPLNGASISKSNRVLFISTQNGEILTLMLPIMITITYNEFKLHNHGITKMSLAMDGSVLISCSEDGSMCIWEVEDVVNKKLNINHRFVYSDDILIKLSKLKKINKDVENITTSLEVLKTDSIHYINELKISKKQELDNLQNTNVDKLDDTRREINVVNKIQTETIRNLENKVTALKEYNTSSMGSLDMNYTNKLMHKYSKYSDLENKTAELNFKRKKSIDELKQKLSEKLQEITENYAEKHKEKQKEMFDLKQKLIDEKNSLRMLFDEIKKDVDKGVLNKKDVLVAKLKEMKQLNHKTTYELAVVKTKYNSSLESNKEIKRLTEDAEKEIDKLNLITNRKSMQLQVKKRLLENNIEALSKKNFEVKEVYQQTLELKKEIDIKNEINASLVQKSISLASVRKNITDSIEQVEKKYKHLNENKMRLQFYLTHLNQIKIDLEYEYDQQKNLIHNTDNVIKYIELDLRLASQNYKKKKDAKTALKEFYSKYTGEMAEITIKKEDIEAREELYRQIKCIEGFIKKIREDKQLSDEKNDATYLIMEENMKLLKEISDLKNDSNKYLTQYKN